MQCKDAEKYIMKYMDSELSEKEAILLNKHILICNECRKDFYFYDDILMNLNLENEFEAPIDFQKSVMSKIEKISKKEYNSCYYTDSRVASIIFCFFSILFAISTLLIIFREPFLNFLLNTPYIGDEIAKFIPVSIKITEQGEILGEVVNNTFNFVNITFLSFIEFITGLLAIICAIKFMCILKKNRMK